jgi:hypothetical protein
MAVDERVKEIRTDMSRKSEGLRKRRIHHDKFYSHYSARIQRLDYAAIAIAVLSAIVTAIGTGTEASVVAYVGAGFAALSASLAGLAQKWTKARDDHRQAKAVCEDLHSRYRMFHMHEVMSLSYDDAVVRSKELESERVAKLAEIVPDEEG